MPSQSGRSFPCLKIASTVCSRNFYPGIISVSNTMVKVKIDAMLTGSYNFQGLNLYLFTPLKQPSFFARITNPGCCFVWYYCFKVRSVMNANLEMAAAHLIYAHGSFKWQIFFSLHGFFLLTNIFFQCSRERFQSQSCWP